MSFRIFKRNAWRANPSWPNGYEPNAVSMDDCPTVEEVETRAEAVEICTEHNDARAHHFESAYFEWTEV